MSTSSGKRQSAGRAKIPAKEQLKLWVKAGGRCEFRGCSEPLFHDSLTLKETNYSDIAHIVAASKRGPRGDDPLPISKRRKFDNLMLLCKKHHKLVDSPEHQAEYSTRLLVGMKGEHEDRIARVTGMLPESKTAVIRLRSKIGNDNVAIRTGDIYDAIAPMYPSERDLDIDLTGLQGTDTRASWEVGHETIRHEVGSFLARSAARGPVEHISIFGFASIPFLMALGHTIGSKIPYDIYQRHRSSQDWKWKNGGGSSSTHSDGSPKGKLANL